MKILCKKVKVKPFGFHAIRHLTASTLYHLGCEVAVIQAILRHKSPGTTKRYLRRIGPDRMRKVLETLTPNKAGAEIIELGNGLGKNEVVSGK